MPSIGDIAKRVRISKTAVSVYLKDPETTRIGSNTKTKINRAIKELNYRPNIIARSLSSKKSKIIALLIPLDRPLFRSTFLNEMLSGLQTYFFSKGYSIIFLPTKGEDSSAMVKNQLEKSYGFDGFILFGTRYCSKKDMELNIEELLKLDLPFVVVNMPELNHPVNQVVTRTPLSSSAIKYLLDLGHNNILLMAGPLKTPDSLEEIQLYKKCHEEKGLAFDKNLVLLGDYERIKAKSEMLQALKKRLIFSSVYCLTDTMALGVYEALSEMNLKVPDDVSVIGKNDSFFSSFMNPPLTTIRVKIFDAGLKAAEILLRSIETREGPSKIFLNNELILRMSTKVWK